MPIDVGGRKRMWGVEDELALASSMTVEGRNFI